MVDPIPSTSLSPMAQARFAACLPGLVQVVRGRRRWRMAQRVALAAVVLAAAIAAWPRGAASPIAPAAGPAPESSTVPICIVLHDDPTVLARCTVADTSRTTWFLDDAGLRALLQAADRPDGLVRIDGRVFVAAEAVDPFPTTSP